MERMETITFLQSYASPTLDVVAQTISDIGSEQGYIALLLAAYLGYDAGIGRRVGVYLLLAFTASFHLKELFGTLRPFVYEPEVLRSSEEDLGFAFPSGHAQASTVFWGYLAVRVRRLGFWIAAVVVVGLIGLSRIYLGLHFPIDVIGGILIGAGLIAAARGLDRAMRRVSLPAWLAFALGLAAPLTVNVLAPPPGDDSGLLMGGLAAFLTAPMLWAHRAPEAWWRKILLVALGVALVLTLLSVSSLALPEDVKRSAIGGYLRYLALGYAGLLLTPWLGAKLGLGRRAA
jgi:membrane-associated phospholipid phosphatase